MSSFTKRLTITVEADSEEYLWLLARNLPNLMENEGAVGNAGSHRGSAVWSVEDIPAPVVVPVEEVRQQKIPRLRYSISSMRLGIEYGKPNGDRFRPVKVRFNDESERTVHVCVRTGKKGTLTKAARAIRSMAVKQMEDEGIITRA